MLHSSRLFITLPWVFECRELHHNSINKVRLAPAPVLHDKLDFNSRAFFFFCLLAHLHSCCRHSRKHPFNELFSRIFLSLSLRRNAFPGQKREKKPPNVVMGEKMAKEIRTSRTGGGGLKGNKNNRQNIKIYPSEEEEV